MYTNFNDTLHLTHDAVVILRQLYPFCFIITECITFITAIHFCVVINNSTKISLITNIVL